MYTIKLNMPEWQTVVKAIKRATKQDPEHYKYSGIGVFLDYQTVWEIDRMALQGLSDAIRSLRDEQGQDEPLCNHILYDIIEAEAKKSGTKLL